MARLTQADFDKIIAMRERGCSYSLIARELGCSTSAVSWHCLRLAVDPPKPAALRPDYHLHMAVVKRGNHIVRAYTPEDDARLVELEQQGKTLSEIGRALGRRSNSIRGRLMTLARRDERASA